MDKPIPIIDDDDTGGFFNAAKRGAIAVLRCTGCGGAIHLPLPRCPDCGSWELYWDDVVPRGYIYSWTVVEHGVHPAFEVPYTVALIELADESDVRLLAHLPGRADMRVGQDAIAKFEDVRDGVIVPQWVPV
jgi:uncharacterized OB-fold protein